jgi:GTP-binding protein
MEGRDIIADYEAIRQELLSYSEALTHRPEIVAANKMDMPDAGENAAKLRAYLEPKGVKVFEISAASGEGTQALMETTAAMLETLPVPEPITEDGVIEEWSLERDDKGYDVYQEDGVYYVDGNLVREILAKTNPDDPDSMRHFQKLLIDFGIIKELRNQGAKTGDTVCLDGLEFDYMD